VVSSQKKGARRAHFDTAEMRWIQNSKGAAPRLRRKQASGG
jgi:hypothetical protein